MKIHYLCSELIPIIVDHINNYKFEDMDINIYGDTLTNRIYNSSNNLLKFCLSNRIFKKIIYNELLDKKKFYYIVKKYNKRVENYFIQLGIYLPNKIMVNYDFINTDFYIYLSNKNLKIVKNFIRYLILHEHITKSYPIYITMVLDIIDYIFSINPNSSEFFKNNFNKLCKLISDPYRKYVLKK